MLVCMIDMCIGPSAFHFHLQKTYQDVDFPNKNYLWNSFKEYVTWEMVIEM